MGDKSSDSGEARPALVQELRDALSAAGGAKIKAVSGPFILDISRMLLEGAQYPAVIERLAPLGVAVSKDTLAKIKPLTERLSDELKDRVRAAAPISPPLAESASIKVLKDTIESVAARIRAIEKDITEKKPLSDKREDQLMKYYQLVVDLRKQLEQERLKSEVVQAYKRGAVDMCMVAMELIQDERTRRQLLEKVRDFEQRNL